MALGITPAYNNDDNSPGFTLSLSGLTGFSEYRVVRLDQGPSLAGAVFADAPVRGADMIPVTANTATVTDYEIPINTTVKYRLEGYISGVLNSSVLTANVIIDPLTASFDVGYDNFWIKDVTNPTLSRAVMVGDFSEVEFNPTILGEYKVLGRKKPVIFTDAWGARAGTFSVQSIDYLGTQKTASELESLLTSGDVLLFQSGLQPYVLQDMYFIVKGLSREQYTHPGRSNTIEFTYQIGFQEVDRPATLRSTFGFGTWGDLKADPALVTWNDVLSGFSTWLDVFNNYTD